MNKPDTASAKPKLKAWGIWSLAALAFGYAFFQRVTPSVMVSDLMADFAIGGAVLGTLSALYFYPYVLMQIPLGVLIDRWGVRALLTIALSVAGLGSVVFAIATNIEMAYAGRLLIGIGSAVGFLGSLAIASKWFPIHYFAMLAGLVMFFGMMSGIFAQGPLAAIVGSFGWRSAMWGLGIAGFSLALLVAIFVRNSPSPEIEKQHQTWASIGTSLKNAAGDWTVWKIALVASTMSGPMLTLGGLWGTPYMQVAYDLDRTSAASSTSILFFGWALAAPFAGWLSDRIQKRRAILIFGAGALCVSLGILVFVPHIPYFVMLVLLAIIGASGASMSVCFALVRECSPPQIGTSVTGIVNSMTVASGAILQPAVGYTLDLLWNGETANGARIYGATDYSMAFTLIFIACIIGFITTLSLKETRVWSDK